MSESRFAPGETVAAVELARSGLLLLGEDVRIDATAVFAPADDQGAARPVEIAAGCRIGAHAVIYGGARLAAGCRVEEGAIVGKPEAGYAVGHLYPGAGADTVIGPEVIVRAGAIVYAGTRVGESTVIGHHTLLRSFVTVGAGTQFGHHLTIERATRIGDGVRCSPGSHITSSCVLADHVFLGAGIRTVNDRELIWREADQQPELVPPRFERGAKVGSGSTILSGVIIGERALVGAGSVVTRSVPADTTAYGVPARVHGQRGQRGQDVQDVQDGAPS